MLPIKLISAWIARRRAVRLAGEREREARILTEELAYLRQKASAIEAREITITRRLSELRYGTPLPRRAWREPEGWEAPNA